MTFEKNYEEQLNMFEGTWEAFKQNGVNEDTKLVLDFSYVTPRKDSANALSSALTNYDTQVSQQGFLMWKKWYIEGSTSAMEAKYEELKSWLEEMIKTGWEFDCEFDGFGAQIPS